MLLNSHNSPLRIDAVIAAHGQGSIGMTLCPGKKEVNAISGNWERDLDTDLMVIQDWGASAVVSLIEAAEMEWFGVAELPMKTIALGMQHFHLPIVDMDVPDQVFEESWLEAGAQLRGFLVAGESIVIHCLAGLGRTGTIAARLLIELGLDTDDAINRVRSARPGTIQTIFQEAYVRRCQAV